MYSLNRIIKHIGPKLCFIMIYVSVGRSYPTYQTRIPNGDIVPHPCIADSLWDGVGHNNSLGAGTRNDFGLDFAENNYEWTAALCGMDSDGDGMTNGEELGDPDCEWEVGDTPQRTTDLSHPGVCTPYDDPSCAGRNDWLTCEQWTCSGIDDESSQEVLFAFPETAVPAEETTYICMSYNITAKLEEIGGLNPSHLVAVEASVDNANVIHHILAYGCPDDVASTVMDNFPTPTSCDMVTDLCSALIGVWAVGLDGICYHENSGVKLGDGGYQYMIMEFHWNNPNLVSSYTDASGLKFHVTPNLRTYDNGILFVGPTYLQIPPAWPSYDQIGGCSSECTNRLLVDQNIYITHVIPHMHYKGKAFSTQIYRDNAMVFNATVDVYNYDSPSVVVYDEPFEVHPGDEIVMKCTFSSSGVRNYIYFGEATADEMCFGIFFYYPFVTSDTFCQTTNNYGFCGGDTARDPAVYGDCDTDAFLNSMYFPLLSIEAECDDEGLVCSDACYTALQPLYNHACYTGPAKDYMMAIMGLQYVGAEGLTKIGSCFEKPPCDDMVYACKAGHINTSATALILAFALVKVIMP